jgi:hypothetical protein
MDYFGPTDRALPHLFPGWLGAGRELSGVGEIYNIHFAKILPGQGRDMARLKTQQKESSDAKNNNL